MKNGKLFSIGTAIGLMIATVPAMAGDSASCNSPSSSNTSANAAWCTKHVSDTAAFYQLPPLVQGTVRSQCGADRVAKFKTEHEKGGTVYVVEFQRRSDTSLRPKMFVAANGAVIKEKNMGPVINEAAGASLPPSPSNK